MAPWPTLIRTAYSWAVPGRTTAKSITLDGDLFSCQFKYIPDSSFRISDLRSIAIRVYAESVGPSEDALWRVSTARGLFNISHYLTRGAAEFESRVQALPGFDLQALQRAIAQLGRGQGTFPCWRAAA
jgi:hypothetical protein